MDQEKGEMHVMVDEVVTSNSVMQVDTAPMRTEEKNLKDPYYAQSEIGRDAGW